MALYPNWQRSGVQSVVVQGSTPWRATRLARASYRASRLSPWSPKPRYGDRHLGAVRSVGIPYMFRSRKVAPPARVGETPVARPGLLDSQESGVDIRQFTH